MNSNFHGLTELQSLNPKFGLGRFDNRSDCNIINIKTILVVNFIG